jgi:type II secretory pathway pseudopilin PulG
MSNKLKAKFLQKGLSLIEASMVLVLSAVVVAGVMVYYQTAQNNNNLDRLSSQVMHIISEINGLYANGKRYNGGTDYANLKTESILAAVNDTESTQIDDGSGKNKVTAIKTAFPNTGLVIESAQTSSAGGGYILGGSGSAGNFAIQIIGVNVAACSKIMGMNFGPQLKAVQVATSAIGVMTSTDIVSATAPFSEKVEKCQQAAAAASGTGLGKKKEVISLIMN